jgi:putative addiction module CopG family antidote
MVAFYLLLFSLSQTVALAPSLDLRHTVKDGGIPMPIQLSPETERLVEQEIASGRFQSVDEIIRQGLRAQGDEAERWKRHRLAIERTRAFAADAPIHLSGVTFQEVIEEGRRL